MVTFMATIFVLALVCHDSFCENHSFTASAISSSPASRDAKSFVPGEGHGQTHSLVMHSFPWVFHRFLFKVVNLTKPPSAINIHNHHQQPSTSPFLINHIIRLGDWGYHSFSGDIYSPYRFNPQKQLPSGYLT